MLRHEVVQSCFNMVRGAEAESVASPLFLVSVIVSVSHSVLKVDAIPLGSQ